MRKLLLVCLFLRTCLGLASTPTLDLRYPPTPAQRKEFLAQGWQAARQNLERELLAAYRPGMGGRPGSTGTSGYRSWLLLWKWCELMERNADSEARALAAQHLYQKQGEKQLTFCPPGLFPDPEYEPASEEAVQALWQNSSAELAKKLLPDWLPTPHSAPLAEDINPQLLQSWITDASFSEALFSLLDPMDYAPGVLANLQAMAAAEPRQFPAYANLALALAVVYDVQFPENWPHHQVDRPTVPLALQPPAKTFSSWIAANESRALMTDLKTLHPSHLKFVVDAPLAAEEFEWARKKARFPRASLDKAFSAVPYKMERISAGMFDWSGPDYTLANILRNGGICVDQAYFAMVVGKAHGVPTLFFTGQGADGGHAWFGYLKTNNRWEMDAGRYANQNYAVGEALDPQTWLPISDHELKLLAEGFRQRPEFAAARDDLLLAQLFEKQGEIALAARAYESATAVCPQSPENWEERAAFLQRTAAPPAVRRSFHEAALRQFENRRDLRVRHQLALADLAREEGNDSLAESIEKKIVLQNRAQRADLSVSVDAQRLTSLLEKKDFDGAFQEYRRMLNSLRRTGGGAFFYEVVEPFARALQKSGNPARALQVCELAERALQPTPGSILAREFQSLSAELQQAGPEA